MLRVSIVIILGLTLLLVAGVGAYLAPDDLGKCDQVPSEKTSCQKADAIIAISGGHTPARTAAAVELYENGWADTLVFSGAAKDTSGPSNAEAMRTQALKAGVPGGDIITESLAQTTKQNADKTQELLRARGIHRVILVTSPYHQRRASLEFRARAGGDVTIVNHPTDSDPDWSVWWWLTPRGWWLAGGELIKIGAFYAGESQ
ncbi:hypothetical protein RAAC3_TM7C00001G0057 [Candidatus Saccharibacteria bacterium RAAC3_TM7_1]|nr:hypothetical protein RAAC3_TM7C00001G0057 [Candidatus Saccharibacteria bacterium RAAC3_TM7_1]HCZ28342.1 YdcF family protein [Candidatus Saccharibacteria bacterium]